LATTPALTLAPSLTLALPLRRATLLGMRGHGQQRFRRKHRNHGKRCGTAERRGADKQVHGSVPDSRTLQKRAHAREMPVGRQTLTVTIYDEDFTQFHG
jgi:hypothetical protein